MERKFAYLDKGGILHIAKDIDDATEKAKKGTTVVPTEFPTEHGYPVANGEQIIVYDEETMKITAGGATLKPIPALAELYSQCR